MTLPNENGNPAAEDTGTNQPGEEDPQQQSQQQEPTGHNPAWDPVLEKLPNEFHNMIRPDLESWDKKYQETLEKYKPFEQFLDVDPSRLAQSQQIMQLLEQSPEVVYERLSQALGRTNTPTNEPQQQEEPASEKGQEDSFDEDDPYAKQLHELKTQQEQLQGMWQQYIQAQEQSAQQQQYEAAVQQETQKLDAEIQALKEKHGEFDEGELIRRMVSNQQMGLPVDTEQAFNDMLAYENRIRQTPTSGQLAPKVMSPNGGMPSLSTKTAEDLSKNERMEAVKQLIAQMNQGD